MADSNGKVFSPKRAAQNRERALEARNKEMEVAGLETGNKVPQAPDIEEAVLGTLMLDPEAVADVVSTLVPECFYKLENRKIYNAIVQLSQANKAIDIYTVAEQLKANKDLDEIGGTVYLTQLSLKIGAAAHIDYHTKILVDKYIQRKMIGISLDALKKSYDDSEPVDKLLDSTQQEIFELAERNMTRDTKPVKSIIAETINKMEEAQQNPNGQSGLHSGYMGLDRVTFGWQNSDLVIIAGRPGMGKTAFVLTMARNMAVDFSIPVAFFSLEQAPEQLVQRLMIAETGISSDKIKGAKKMTDSDWVQLSDKLNRLVDAPLYIDDTPSLSITDLRAKARKLVQTAHVKMIIIDYLQLMTGSKELKGFREQEVSEISRSLKSIAKELDIPVIALAQLSRAAEIRGGQKKPQLTDLRESGAIEQDADIVIFLHRPEYYGTTDANMPEGLTDVIIAKHRNGPTDDVHMRFVKREMRFADFNDQELPSDEELNVMENNIGNFDGNNGGAPVSFSSKINGNDFTTNEFPVE